MALRQRTPIGQHEIVCTFDGCVTASRPDAVGWVGLELATCADGADVLTVRPLTIAQRAHARDAGSGVSERLLAIAREGVVGVNGSGDPAAAAAWFDALADDTLATLLGAYIEDMTEGTKPAARQRRFCGVADEPEADG